MKIAARDGREDGAGPLGQQRIEPVGSCGWIEGTGSTRNGKLVGRQPLDPKFACRSRFHPPTGKARAPSRHFLMTCDPTSTSAPDRILFVGPDSPGDHLRRALGVAAVALAAVGAGCSGSDAELGQRIAAEVAKGAGTVVRLAEVADFSWDELHIFDPYSSRDLIESRLGFEWPQADHAGIQDSDGVTLLVFVKNGGVVRYVTQPRNQGDFAGLNEPAGLTPTEAIFTVTSRGDGAFVLVPVRETSK
jgi:hypothetical protein